jgi:hypothetical protein
MKFNYVEGNVVFDALENYDEYFLARSISRRVLYPLIRKFIIGLGIEIDRGYNTPNLFHDKFDNTKSFEVDLNIDEIDYINRAVMAANYAEKEAGYPIIIQEAANKIYHETYEALKDIPEITLENEKLFTETF